MSHLVYPTASPVEMSRRERSLGLRSLLRDFLGPQTRSTDRSPSQHSPNTLGYFQTQK